MNVYVIQVMLAVEVEAFNEKDAREAVADCFGEGDFCGVVVQDFEVTDLEALV